jgi:hypothetical protein
MLGLTSFVPIPSFILLGLSYAIYGVVIWPSVATVAQQEEERLLCAGVETKLLGTAFGVSTSCLNTALTILPLIAASIRVEYKSFVYLELFFAGLAATAVGFCGLLYVQDFKDGGVLQRASNDEDTDTISSELTYLPE